MFVKLISKKAHMKKFTHLLSRSVSPFMRKSAFVIMLFASVISMHAQPVFSIVGNGTTFNTNTSYPAPFGNYFWASRNQMFVTAAELTAAGLGAGVSIKSIGFNIQSLNNAPAHQNWVVTVYTTTST